MLMSLASEWYRLFISVILLLFNIVDGGEGGASTDIVMISKCLIIYAQDCRYVLTVSTQFQRAVLVFNT